MIALHVSLVLLLSATAFFIFASAIRSVADSSDDVFEDMRQLKLLLAFAITVFSIVFAVDKLSDPVSFIHIAQMAVLTVVAMVSAGAAVLFDPENSYPEYFARDGRGDVA